jgi:Flp pilus assembly protein TadG
MIAKLRRDLNESLARFARLRREKRGVAAVEFALILPVLVTMYLGTIEVTQAVMANRKMVATTSALGDLAAQAQVLGNSDVTNVFAAATATMQPFSTTSLQMRVTQVKVLGGIARVAWSEGSGGMLPLSVGSVYASFPSSLLPTDPLVTQYYILSEVSYTYTSPIGNLLLSRFVSSMSMSDTFWLRPRIGECVRRNDTCG